MRKKYMQKIELLAPAKDKNIAKTAITYGADAIYIGAPAFGARCKATNNIEDIEETINFAHKFGAKVYITMNTILTDKELLEAEKLIEKLHQAKADGLIIQDMGLLEIDLPPIALFASTQCHNISLEKIQFLEKCGFSRIILPRELSISQIENISKNTSLHLESFIHGALCVSYSGQCYFSHAIGKRSANRGECAQVCRKKYSLITSENKTIIKDQHLLSLKDFNASNHLESLIKAGISSFKIEGRMKDENYVKNVVAFYRKAIDKLIEDNQKTSIGKVYLDFEPNLNKTFNRGYTDYFLQGKRPSQPICNFYSPKSMGEKIGQVDKVFKNYFTLKTGSLNQSDGFCFISNKKPNKELLGSKVNKIENNKIYPQSMEGIEPNVIIFRNFDFEFEKNLKNSSSNRLIDAVISISEKRTEFIFEIEDIENTKAEFFIKKPIEPAKNKENMTKNLQKQLQKSGNSEFFIKDIKIKTENIPFLPISQINEIRRELLNNLIAKRIENYIPIERKILKTSHPYPEKELDFQANILNQKAIDFYTRHGAKIKEMALEYGTSAQNKPIMTTHHCILHSIQKCKKSTQNSTQYYLVDDKGKKYKLEFDCKNCQMKIIF